VEIFHSVCNGTQFSRSKVQTEKNIKEHTSVHLLGTLQVQENNNIRINNDLNCQSASITKGRAAKFARDIAYDS
jgi:hypothetical protein